MTDPEALVARDATGLAAIFGLTTAEARVAMGLMNGQTVAQIAADLDVSKNTVRWHLKHVLQKAGVRTQAQLVRLALLGSVGLTASD